MTSLVWTPKPVEIPGPRARIRRAPYGLVTVRQLPLITVGTGWYEDLRVVARNGRRRNAITCPGFNKGVKPASTGKKYPPEPLTNTEALALLAVIPQRTITGVRNRSESHKSHRIFTDSDAFAFRCRSPRQGRGMWISESTCLTCGTDFTHKPCHQSRKPKYCPGTCRNAAVAAIQTKPWQERFWRFVKPAGTDECWEWQGMRNKQGYGKLSTTGRSIIFAHRASYVLANGAFDRALDVLHTCDNPPCVNPAHLFLGTHTDNMRDMARKGRSGTRFASANSATRVPWESVQEIRRRRAAGETGRALAAEFGVSEAYVSCLHRNVFRRDA